MYFIDLRADSRGGNPVADIDGVVVRSSDSPSPATSLLPDLQSTILGRDVLLETHGFHVDRSAGIDNLNQWSKWLKLGDNGVFVGALWPGDSRWIPYLDYPVEGDEAIKSGDLLAQFLNAHFTGVASLSFTSHSLGARMILETIEGLSDDFKAKLHSATIMAGAIDDTCLTGEYRKAAAKMKKISVLASQCDDVLKWAFPEGNLLSGIITRGDPYWHGALGRNGPNPPGQPPNLAGNPILSDDWKFGHGSYINCYPPGAPPVRPPFSPPVTVGDRRINLAIGMPSNWQQAFAAGFVSTRF